MYLSPAFIKYCYSLHPPTPSLSTRFLVFQLKLVRFIPVLTISLLHLTTIVVVIVVVVVVVMMVV